jgi:rhodanese-related sulfurtransferase
MVQRNPLAIAADNAGSGLTKNDGSFTGSYLAVPILDLLAFVDNHLEDELLWCLGIIKPGNLIVTVPCYEGGCSNLATSSLRSILRTVPAYCEQHWRRDKV